MIRFVDDVTAYGGAPGNPQVIGLGVTHYQAPWQPWMRGAPILEQLLAAGLPDSIKVSRRVAENGSGMVLDVAILLDDQGEWAAVVEQIIEAPPEPEEEPDGLATREVPGDVARRDQRRVPEPVEGERRHPG